MMNGHRIKQIEHTRDVSISILTGGNILLLIILFSPSKATDANIANFV